MKTSRVAFTLLLLVATLSVSPVLHGRQDADVTGIWLAADVTYAPWVFDLKQSGTTLTGTVRQSGAVTTVAPIQGGTVRENELSFTLNRAGAGGTITFSGIRNGETIVFTRTAEVASGIGDGLFGPVGPARATATRQPLGAAPPVRATTVTTTANTPASTDGPRYLATTGVAFAPWTFVLKMENGVVTGSVTQSTVDPPSGFSTSLVGPFEIQDGKLEGNQITFKIAMPDGSRVVTFKGARDGDTIAFTRSIEVLRGDGGRDGIMGISGATELSATLNAAPVPATAAPRVTATPSNTPAPTAAQIGAAGRWHANNVPNGPWIFEFVVNGSLLTGAIQQSGAGNSPVTIAGGRVEGTNISFRVLSPDAERTITFRGRVNGNEISFAREIAVLAGGGRGGNDLFGGGAPLQFIATRAANGNVLNHRGMTIDVTSIQAAANRDAIIESLRRQIEIVDLAQMKPEQKEFLKSIPVTIGSASGADNGNYGGSRVTLSAGVFDRDKPVLLHELLHGYHDQKLPDGFRNATIIALHQQARDSRQFPSGSYMLAGASEYFAMMASVYLHGSAARDPYKREVIREKQPDCYQWLAQEFGAR